MPPPRVSVILPVFNAEPTIGRAITSIRAQTFQDWELLVVDDGSTDGTSQTVRGIAREDFRVRLIERHHQGIVASLEAGLDEARSELIARMDADDESTPDRLAEQVALLDQQPQLGLVSCLVGFGGDVVANAGYALHVDWINSLVTPEQIALNRFVESPFAHPTVVFRRELLDRLGGYQAGDFPEDYELWLRWLDEGVPMAKVPRVLLRWNDPPARLSRTDTRYDVEKFFALKARWLAQEIINRGHLLRRPSAAAGKKDAPEPDSYGRKLWIWGAGRPTRKRASLLELYGLRIAGYIDIDPKKTGRNVEGVPIVSPVEMPSRENAFVLGYVSSRGARDLIRDELLARGFEEGADFLMCA